MAFGGLFVRAIGFKNNHVKHDGEGSHFHHAHTTMVTIFETKGCVTWCPKRLQEKVTRTSPDRDNDVIKMFFTTSAENNWIYLHFQKPHEDYIPTNQASR
jgi:hypothetical protein